MGLLLSRKGKWLLGGTYAFFQATLFLYIHFPLCLSVCLSFVPLWLSSFPLSAQSFNSSAQHLKEPQRPSPAVHLRFHTKDIVSIMLVTVAKHAGAIMLALHMCFQFHVVAVDMLPSWCQLKFQAISCYPLCVVVCVWIHAKEVIPEPPDGTVSWSCHWQESLQGRCPGKHWQGFPLLREREGGGRNWHLLTYQVPGLVILKCDLKCFSLMPKWWSR